MADPGFHTIKKIGEQDVYLTGNPEISYFKKVFRRHTRFFKQYKQINFERSGDEQFGSDLSATIKHDHHLLGEMYLEMVIKGTSNAVNQYTVNHFGNSCIKNVTLKIGSRTIDKHTGQWLQIYKELHEPNYNFSEIGSQKQNSSSLGGGRKTVFNMDHSQDRYSCDSITPIDTWSLDDRLQGDYPLVFGGMTASNITSSTNSITWTFDVVGNASGSDVWITVGNVEHGLSVGDKVKMISAGTGADGYNQNGIYYVIEVPTTTTVKLSGTKGGPVIISSTDSSGGTWKMQQIDYRSLIVNNTGSFAVGEYEKKIRVPLRFFFNNNPGLALPMCALQRGGDRVRIDVQLEKKANLIGDVNSLSLSSIKLYGEQYYLSNDEVMRFKNGSHMYLIEQLQINGDTAIPSYISGTETNERNVDLGSIKFPVKYFTFSVQEEISNGTKGVGPCYFRSIVPNTFYGNDGCYKSDTGSLQLMLDSDVTTERLPLDYYTRILPKRFCKGRIPDLDRIGIYSFALKPLDLDPSGTCNFSLFNKKQLNIKLSGNSDNLSGYNTGNKKLLIYAVNYNIFRVVEGHGGVLYI